MAAVVAFAGRSRQFAEGLRRAICVTATIAAVAPAVATAAPDPLISQQWALADPAAIGAAEAWTQSDGARVLVAVLDTGLQLDHPDIEANVWTNPGEIARNGIDDDRSGIVDDVNGANMLNLSADVGDDNGHGTHVAGIIAARRGNGIGGSGLAPGARILPVKVLDSTMSGTTDALALGIRYAVDRGAKILNVSVNTDTATENVKSAVRYAGERGAIVVASAGNNARNIDLLPSYPAALADPAILSIAASNHSGSLLASSNTGLAAVDLGAPGDHIVATAIASGSQSRTGTSAAAPFVSASLALLSAARPDLPMSALSAVVVSTARQSNVLAALLGGGTLDVGAAMHRIRPGTAWIAPAAAMPRAAPTLRLRSTSASRTSRRVTLRWTASGADDVTRWRVSLDGRIIRHLPVASARFSRRITRRGRHVWRVVGFDAAATKVVDGRRAFRTTTTH